MTRDVFENQLRQAIEKKRLRLIDHLRTLSFNDETPFEQLTLSELEIEWRYYFDKDSHQAN